MEKIHKKTTKIHNLSKSQTTSATNKNADYPRVVNTTIMQFTQEQIQILLLSQGLKYNLHYKQKTGYKRVA
jgi:hypothetical protein